MCNLYTITTNQTGIIALFRVTPMPGVFPEYPAQVTSQRRAGPRDDAVALGHAAAQDNGVG